MRFMILVKASKDTEAGVMPSQDVFDAMGDYHEQLKQAGVLVDGNGLQPSAKGWRIRFDGRRRTVIDGPFAETKELIAGFTIIDVKSRQEAMDWANRFPNPTGESGEIEVRQMYELEDLGPDADIGRFRELGVGIRK